MNNVKIKLKKAIAFILAIFMMLSSSNLAVLAEEIEKAIENDEDAIVNNGVVLNITSKNTEVKTGEKHEVVIKNSYANPNDEDSAICKIYLKDADGNASDTVQLLGFVDSKKVFTCDDNDDLSVTVELKETTDSKGNVTARWLEYELQPGTSVEMEFQFTVPNGYYKEESLVIEPEITHSSSDGSNDKISDKLTIKWTGSFAWSNLQKFASIETLNKKLDNVQENVQYTYSADSGNMENTGSIWTEKAVFKDSLTLLDEMIIDGEITTQGNALYLDGTIIYEITVDDTYINDYQLDSLTYDDQTKTISYELTINNEKDENGNVSQEFNPVGAVTATLYTNKIKFTENYIAIGTEKIKNEITIDFYPVDARATVITLNADKTITLNKEYLSLTMAKYVDKTQATKGDEINYTVSIQNDTNQSLNGTFYDYLPSGISLTDEAVTKLKAAGYIVGSSKTIVKEDFEDVSDGNVYEYAGSKQFVSVCSFDSTSWWSGYFATYELPVNYSGTLNEGATIEYDVYFDSNDFQEVDSDSKIQIDTNLNMSDWVSLSTSIKSTDLVEDGDKYKVHIVQELPDEAYNCTSFTSVWIGVVGVKSGYTGSVGIDNIIIHDGPVEVTNAEEIEFIEDFEDEDDSVVEYDDSNMYTKNVTFSSSNYWDATNADETMKFMWEKYYMQDVEVKDSVTVKFDVVLDPENWTTGSIYAISAVMVGDSWSYFQNQIELNNSILVENTDGTYTAHIELEVSVGDIYSAFQYGQISFAGCGSDFSGDIYIDNVGFYIAPQGNNTIIKDITITKGTTFTLSYAAQVNNGTASTQKNVATFSSDYKVSAETTTQTTDVEPVYSDIQIKKEIVARYVDYASDGDTNKITSDEDGDLSLFGDGDLIQYTITLTNTSGSTQQLDLTDFSPYCSSAYYDETTGTWKTYATYTDEITGKMYMLGKDSLSEYDDLENLHTDFVNRTSQYVNNGEYTKLTVTIPSGKSLRQTFFVQAPSGDDYEQYLNNIKNAMGTNQDGAQIYNTTSTTGNSSENRLLKYEPDNTICVDEPNISAKVDHTVEQRYHLTKAVVGKNNEDMFNEPNSYINYYEENMNTYDADGNQEITYMLYLVNDSIYDLDMSTTVLEDVMPSGWKFKGFNTIGVRNYASINYDTVDRYPYMGYRTYTGEDGNEYKIPIATIMPGSDYESGNSYVFYSNASNTYDYLSALTVIDKSVPESSSYRILNSRSITSGTGNDHYVDRENSGHTSVTSISINNNIVTINFTPTRLTAGSSMMIAYTLQPTSETCGTAVNKATWIFNEDEIEVSPNIEVKMYADTECGGLSDEHQNIGECTQSSSNSISSQVTLTSEDCLLGYTTTGVLGRNTLSEMQEGKALANYEEKDLNYYENSTGEVVTFFTYIANTDDYDVDPGSIYITLPQGYEYIGMNTIEDDYMTIHGSYDTYSKDLSYSQTGYSYEELYEGIVETQPSQIRTASLPQYYLSKLTDTITNSITETNQKNFKLIGMNRYNLSKYEAVYDMNTTATFTATYNNEYTSENNQLIINGSGTLQSEHGVFIVYSCLVHPDQVSDINNTQTAVWETTKQLKNDTRHKVFYGYDSPVMNVVTNVEYENIGTSNEMDVTLDERSGASYCSSLGELSIGSALWSAVELQKVGGNKYYLQKSVIGVNSELEMNTGTALANYLIVDCSEAGDEDVVTFAVYLENSSGDIELANLNIEDYLPAGYEFLGFNYMTDELIKKGVVIDDKGALVDLYYLSKIQQECETTSDLGLTMWEYTNYHLYDGVAHRLSFGENIKYTYEYNEGDYKNYKNDSGDNKVTFNLTGTLKQGEGLYIVYSCLVHGDYVSTEENKKETENLVYMTDKTIQSSDNIVSDDKIVAGYFANTGSIGNAGYFASKNGNIGYSNTSSVSSDANEVESYYYLNNNSTLWSGVNMEYVEKEDKVKSVTISKSVYFTVDDEDLSANGAYYEDTENETVSYYSSDGTYASFSNIENMKTALGLYYSVIDGIHSTRDYRDGTVWQIVVTNTGEETVSLENLIEKIDQPYEVYAAECVKMGASGKFYAESKVEFINEEVADYTSKVTGEPVTRNVYNIVNQESELTILRPGEVAVYYIYTNMTEEKLDWYYNTAIYPIDDIDDWTLDGQEIATESQDGYDGVKSSDWTSFIGTDGVKWINKNEDDSVSSKESEVYIAKQVENKDIKFTLEMISHLSETSEYTDSTIKNIVFYDLLPGTTGGEATDEVGGGYTVNNDSFAAYIYKTDGEKVEIDSSHYTIYYTLESLHGGRHPMTVNDTIYNVDFSGAESAAWYSSYNDLTDELKAKYDTFEDFIKDCRAFKIVFDNTVELEDEDHLYVDYTVTPRDDADLDIKYYNIFGYSYFIDNENDALDISLYEDTSVTTIQYTTANNIELQKKVIDVYGNEITNLESVYDIEYTLYIGEISKDEYEKIANGQNVELDEATEIKLKVGKKYSTEDLYQLFGLSFQYGAYYAIEETADSSYILSNITSAENEGIYNGSQYAFYADEKKSNDITVINQITQRGTIVINKVDEDDNLLDLTENQITYGIKDSNGNYINVKKSDTNENSYYYVESADNDSISEIETASSTIKIDNLPVDTYTIEEIKAPEGYKLLTEGVAVEIDDSNYGMETEVRITNIKIENDTTLQINKIDSTTKEIIDDDTVEFEITNSASSNAEKFEFVFEGKDEEKGNVYKLAEYSDEDTTTTLTTSNGKIFIKGLEVGTDYFVKETKAPYTYTKDSSRKINITKDDKDITLNVENTKYTFDYIIRKVDEKNNIITDTATFSIYTNDGEIAYFKKMDNLQNGETADYASYYKYVAPDEVTSDCVTELETCNGGIYIEGLLRYNPETGNVESYSIKEQTPPDGFEVAITDAIIYYYSYNKLTIIKDNVEQQVMYKNITNNHNIANMVIYKKDTQGNIITTSEAQFEVLSSGVAVKFEKNEENGSVYYTPSDSGSTTLTTTEGIITIKNMPVGEYQIQETKAPENYKIDTEPKTVILTALNYYGVLTESFTNESLVADITLNKINKNGEKLSGAQFKILNANGETIKFEKQDNGGSEEYVVSDEGEEIITLSTGTAKIINLPTEEELTIVEVSAPQGYALTEELKMILIDADKFEEKVVDITDTPDNGNAYIEKVDEQGNVIDADSAEFELYDENGEIVKLAKITDEDNVSVYEVSYNNEENTEETLVAEKGKLRINNLQIGKYTLVETKAPNNFEIGEETQFEISADNYFEELTLQVENTATCGDLRIDKLDTNGDLIESDSVVFKVYNENGELVKFSYDGEKDEDNGRKYTYDADGDYNNVTSYNGKVYIENLPVGKYYLKEAVAPEGYSRYTDEIKFEITSDNYYSVYVLPVQNPEYSFGSEKYVSTSYQKIEENDNPDNYGYGYNGKATDYENGNYNYIVVDSKDDLVKYTLRTINMSNKNYENFVMINKLPDIGDTGAINLDKERGSEFTINLAEDQDIIVKVYDADGDEVNISEDDYTISYSSKTEFTESDWDGKSEWAESASDDTRSFRVAFADDFELLPSYTVEITFLGEIQDNATPGAIAWNSFGYRYYVGDVELTPEPPKVGVKIPYEPEITKITDIETDETFYFDVIDVETNEIVATVEVKSGETVKLEKLKTVNGVQSGYLENGKTYRIQERDSENFTLLSVTSETAEEYPEKQTANESNYEFTYDSEEEAKVTFTNKFIEEETENPEKTETNNTEKSDSEVSNEAEEQKNDEVESSEEGETENLDEKIETETVKTDDKILISMILVIVSSAVLALLQLRKFSKG